MPDDRIPLLTANGQGGKRSDDGILDSILHRKNFLTQVCLVRVMATLLPEAAVLVGHHARDNVPVPDFGPENIAVLRRGAWDAKAAELMPEREFEDAVAESPSLRLAEPERRVREAQARVATVRASDAAAAEPSLETELVIAELRAAEDFESRMRAVEASRLRPSTLRCSAGRDAAGATIITETDHRIPGPRTRTCSTVLPERRSVSEGTHASAVFCVGSVLHALAFVGAKDRRTHVPPPSTPIASLIGATRLAAPAARPTLAELAALPVLAVAHEFLGLASQEEFVRMVASLSAGHGNLGDRWWRRVQNPPRPGQQVPVGKLGGRHKPAPPPRPEFGSLVPIRSGSAGQSSSSSSSVPPCLPTSVAAYARSGYTCWTSSLAPAAISGMAGATRRSSRIRIHAPPRRALGEETDEDDEDEDVGDLTFRRTRGGGAPSAAGGRPAYTARVGASSSSASIDLLAYSVAVADAMDTFVPSEGSDIFRVPAPHDTAAPYPSTASSSSSSSAASSAFSMAAVPVVLPSLVVSRSGVSDTGLAAASSDNVFTPAAHLDGSAHDDPLSFAATDALAAQMTSSLGFGSSRGTSDETMVVSGFGFGVESGPAEDGDTPPATASAAGGRPAASGGTAAHRAAKRPRDISVGGSHHASIAWATQPPWGAQSAAPGAPAMPPSSFVPSHAVPAPRLPFSPPTSTVMDVLGYRPPVQRPAERRDSVPDQCPEDAAGAGLDPEPGMVRLVSVESEW